MGNIRIVTLEAKRVKETDGSFVGFYKTEIFHNGKLIATFPAEQKQPHKNSKSIMLNCNRYSLKWIN